MTIYGDVLDTLQQTQNYVRQPLWPQVFESIAGAFIREEGWPGFPVDDVFPFMRDYCQKMILAPGDLYYVEEPMQNFFWQRFVAEHRSKDNTFLLVPPRVRDFPAPRGYIQFARDWDVYSDTIQETFIDYRGMIWETVGYTLGGHFVESVLFAMITPIRDTRSKVFPRPYIIPGNVFGMGSHLGTESRAGLLMSPKEEADRLEHGRLITLLAYTWDVIKGLQERVTETREVLPQTRGALRAARKKYHHVDPIKVISLRAIDLTNYTRPTTTTPVEWSVRWKVREHKRRLKSGKIVTVREHEKGPPDKPLREYDATIYDVRR